jgi:hypothetical protein
MLLAIEANMGHHDMVNECPAVCWLLCAEVCACCPQNNTKYVMSQNTSLDAESALNTPIQGARLPGSEHVMQQVWHSCKHKAHTSDTRLTYTYFNFCAYQCAAGHSAPHKAHNIMHSQASSTHSSLQLICHACYMRACLLTASR